MRPQAESLVEVDGPVQLGPESDAPTVRLTSDNQSPAKSSSNKYDSDAVSVSQQMNCSG